MGKRREAAHVWELGKFAGQNEAVFSLLLAGDSTLVKSLRPVLMDLHNFVLICLGLFAEIKDTVGGYSCPADFGGANFPVPQTTRKADFVGESNFFTPSLKLRGDDRGYMSKKDERKGLRI